ncbi:ASKHA domain-containing protein [Clostridium sp. WILCCON 0269]|uniref:ASKHA domain-containing protein n=1 Tax=Candidatus Clostridium eludens TaxID=3381663 RepID=A0ABW8SFF1_9CLOT
MQVNVIFQPIGRRGIVCSGETILEVSRKFGVDLESPCGGNGTCGKCKVKLEKGFFEKYGINSDTNNVSPITEKEKEILTKEEQLQNYRLACCTKITGDIVISVPAESERGKQVILEASKSKLFNLNSAVKKYYIELEKPTLQDYRDDFTRVRDALVYTYKHLKEDIVIDYRVLTVLSSILRKQKYKITVALWMDKEIISVEPGLNEEVYGVAIDIGTTTIAASLCDLSTGEVLKQASSLNPQIKYGDDVLSRISYCVMNKNGLEEMHTLIIKEINKLLEQMVTSIHASVTQVYDMVLVFNTAMHHITLNIDPEYLGQSPFPSAVKHGLDIKSRELGINICKGAYVYSLPIEAGFVGADNVSVLISEEPYKQDKLLMAIDIGTNGEIDFGNNEMLFSTSCATGPALEGAQIKYGMRAASGAIEKVKIDPISLEPDFKVIGEDHWNTINSMQRAKGICGSGIIDAIAEMYKTGIIGTDGAFNKKIKSHRIRRDEEGRMEYVLAWKQDTYIGKDISITQKDVRAVQLAKSALYAGAKILMRKRGVDFVDGIILAGAFGNYINKENALVIGLFPDCDLKNVINVGNAAGEGAKMALLNISKRVEADEIAKNIQFVESAAEEDFQIQFYDAMNFPHSKDEFPHIKHILDSIPK